MLRYQADRNHRRDLRAIQNNGEVAKARDKEMTLAASYRSVRSASCAKNIYLSVDSEIQVSEKKNLGKSRFRDIFSFCETCRLSPRKLSGPS